MSLRGRVGDRRLVGVDRDGHLEARGQGLDHRDHAAQLLDLRNRRRARPRGLAAHVDEVCTRVHHPQRRVYRRADALKRAAVGERVRRDVQDAHDEGSLAEFEPAAIGERHGVPASRLHRRYETL